MSETSTPGTCSLQSIRLLLNLIIRLKFCSYNIVHISLEEFRFSHKSSLRAQSVCHTLRPGIGVGGSFGPGVKFHVFRTRVGVGIPQKNKDSRVPRVIALINQCRILDRFFHTNVRFYAECVALLFQYRRVYYGSQGMMIR